MANADGGSRTTLRVVEAPAQTEAHSCKFWVKGSNGQHMCGGRVEVDWSQAEPDELIVGVKVTWRLVARGTCGVCKRINLVNRRISKADFDALKNAPKSEIVLPGLFPAAVTA